MSATSGLLTHYKSLEPFVTKDGSIIRELMHPAVHGVQRQSLAEAIVPAGARTLRHRHRESEELYHITQGYGEMVLGKDVFEVAPGDTVCIPPGTEHCICNIGDEALHILCACTPPYRHEDTELMEEEAP